VTDEEVFVAALKLVHEKRADLAGRLLRSLDEEEEQLSPEECEKLWLAEAERRLQEWEEGKVKGIPAEEVFARARALLRS
jgi:putative addiction module component (TIGR02574 family)